jgi:hypothetical protein
MAWHLLDKASKRVRGAAIGGALGSGGGPLLRLNQNKMHNEAYRAAYARCMASRGYGS